MAHFKAGYFTGATTAASKNINIGFTPDYFRIWNISDGDVMEWSKGPSATYLGFFQEAGTGFYKVGAASKGLTIIGASSAATFKGVTLGLNTKFNIASKLYRWIAFQQD